MPTLVPSSQPESPEPSLPVHGTVNTLRLRNATLSLRNVEFVENQTVCWYKKHMEQKPHHQLQVVNATIMPHQLWIRDTDAAAALDLSNIEHVVVGRSLVPTNNSIEGLFNSRTCTVYLGNANLPLDVRIANVNSSLLVECPQARQLLLENQGGMCLAAVLPNAANIEVAGNATVAVVINADLTMPVVDVGNLTAGGQLLLHLTNGTSSSGMVQGTLPYRLPDDKYAVVVRGCQPKRMPCTAVDAAGRDVCYYDNTCCGGDFHQADSLCVTKAY